MCKHGVKSESKRDLKEKKNVMRKFRSIFGSIYITNDPTPNPSHPSCVKQLHTSLKIEIHVFLIIIVFLKIYEVCQIFILSCSILCFDVKLRSFD